MYSKRCLIFLFFFICISFSFEYTVQFTLTFGYFPFAEQFFDVFATEHLKCKRTHTAIVWFCVFFFCSIFIVLVLTPHSQNILKNKLYLVNIFHIHQHNSFQCYLQMWSFWARLFLCLHTFIYFIPLVTFGMLIFPSLFLGWSNFNALLY